MEAVSDGSLSQFPHFIKNICFEIIKGWSPPPFLSVGVSGVNRELFNSRFAP